MHGMNRKEKRNCGVQKESEPIHMYRVTDNTQIRQMSRDMGNPVAVGWLRHCYEGKENFGKGRHKIWGLAGRNERERSYKQLKQNKQHISHPYPGRKRSTKP